MPGDRFPDTSILIQAFAEGASAAPGLRCGLLTAADAGGRLLLSVDLQRDRRFGTATVRNPFRDERQRRLSAPPGIVIAAARGPPASGAGAAHWAMR
jgi:hypothetical protein